MNKLQILLNDFLETDLSFKGITAKTYDPLNTFVEFDKEKEKTDELAFETYLDSTRGINNRIYI